MYLHTFGERENGSVFEEPFEGRNLSKLNLCEDGESRRAAPFFIPAARTQRAPGGSHGGLAHPGSSSAICPCVDKSIWPGLGSVGPRAAEPRRNPCAWRGLLVGTLGSGRCVPGGCVSQSRKPLIWQSLCGGNAQGRTGP